MQVVGSGFGRTGTTSMKAALELLGFGPCYHMEEVFKRPAHVRAWTDHRTNPPDLRAVLAGFNSAVDFPASLVYRELLDLHPGAKVVHTVRPADRWHASAMSTIYFARSVFTSVPLRYLPITKAYLAMVDSAIWNGLFDGRFADPTHAIGVYEQWTSDVVANVPTDQLLVFDVAEGWEPLCRFLAVPVPDQPFPRVNDKATFRRRLLAARTASQVLPTAIAGVAVLAWHRRRTR